MKKKNPLVLFLVGIILVVFVGLYLMSSDDKLQGVTTVKTTDAKNDLESSSAADADKLPEGFNALVATVQSLQGQLDGLSKIKDHLGALKSEQKLKSFGGLAVKDKAESLVEQLVPQSLEKVAPEVETISIEPGQVSAIDPLSNSTTGDSLFSGLDGITAPISIGARSKKDEGTAYLDPDEVVWIKSMDSSYEVVDTKKIKNYVSNSTSNLLSGDEENGNNDPNVFDEVGSKAQKKLGLQAGLIPMFTIPNGALIARASSVTALIGRIPIKGQVQDPWRFKLMTGREIVLPNNHSLEGLEQTIVQGTAIGDLNLRCVTGKIDSITFIFEDGRIVSHKAKDKKEGLGYVTDQYANPCLSGELITNAPQAIANIGLIGAAEGFSKALADAETTTTQFSSGSTGTAVVGDHLTNAGFNAVSAGAGDVKQWFTDRMGQFFDVIYVPAGQVVDIHITEEIQIDYDPMGRKVRYENTVTGSYGGLD